MAKSDKRDLLRQVLEHPIAFHRIFAALCGSASAGLMLSQAYYWTQVVERTNGRADGWFYKTQQHWQQETLLSRYEQESARRILRRLGNGEVWQEERRGITRQLFFRLDVDRLCDAIAEYVKKGQTSGRGKTHNRSAENQQTGMLKTNRLNVENQQTGMLKTNTLIAEKPHSFITETTSETTEKKKAKTTSRERKSLSPVSAPSFFSSKADGQTVSLKQTAAVPLPAEFKIDVSEFPNHPPNRVLHSFEKFRDYHLAKGTCRVNWNAEFRVWLKRGQETGWDADTSGQSFEVTDYSQTTKDFWNNVLVEEWPGGEGEVSGRSLALGIGAVDRVLKTGIDPAVLKRAILLYTEDKRNERKSAPDGKVRVKTVQAWFGTGNDAPWREYARLAGNQMKSERAKQKEIDEMQAEQAQTKSA